MLLSGDIANMPMDLGVDPNSPREELDKYERDLQDVVAASAQICSNLYYIPGNVILPRLPLTLYILERKLKLAKLDFNPL